MTPNSLTRHIDAERALGIQMFTGSTAHTSPASPAQSVTHHERLPVLRTSAVHSAAMVRCLELWPDVETVETLEDWTARMIALEAARRAAGDCRVELEQAERILGATQ